MKDVLVKTAGKKHHFVPECHKVSAAFLPPCVRGIITSIYQYIFYKKSHTHNYSLGTAVLCCLSVPFGFFMLTSMSLRWLLAASSHQVGLFCQMLISERQSVLALSSIINVESICLCLNVGVHNMRACLFRVTTEDVPGEQYSKSTACAALSGVSWFQPRLARCGCRGGTVGQVVGPPLCFTAEQRQDGLLLNSRQTFFGFQIMKPKDLWF